MWAQLQLTSTASRRRKPADLPNYSRNIVGIVRGYLGARAPAVASRILCVATVRATRACLHSPCPPMSTRRIGRPSEGTVRSARGCQRVLQRWQGQAARPAGGSRAMGSDDEYPPRLPIPIREAYRFGCRGDFRRTESSMEYTVTAAFLLAVVAGSLAAVILAGYGIAHLIASAL